MKCYGFIAVRNYGYWEIYCGIESYTKTKILICRYVLLILSLVHLISKSYLPCSYGSEETPVTDLRELPFCQVIIYNKIRVVIWFPLLLQVTVCVRKLTCVCIISAFICMCGWWWDSSNRVGQGMPDFLFDLLWFHAMDDLFNTALTVGIHWSISFMICGGCIFFFFGISNAVRESTYPFYSVNAVS